MTDRDQVATDVREALLLLGGLQRVLRTCAPAQRADADRIADGISRRLWQALYQLEPRRAALAGR